MADVVTQMTEILPALHSLTESDLVFVTGDEIIRLYDEAVKRLAANLTLFVAIDTSITLVSGQAEYSLPSRHLATIRIALPTGMLTASTSRRLEVKDDAFGTTTGTPTDWYQDKIGSGVFRLYPVPNTTGTVVTVIYLEYPAELDCERSTRTIPAPDWIVDMLDWEVLAEVYGQNSDAQMPEVAAHLKQLVGFYQQAAEADYGGGR